MSMQAIPVIYLEGGEHKDFPPTFPSLYRMSKVYIGNTNVLLKYWNMSDFLLLA